MTSDRWYKAQFKKECIGKSGPAGIAYYPDLQQARKAAGLVNKVKIEIFCSSPLLLTLFAEAYMKYTL